MIRSTVDNVTKVVSVNYSNNMWSIDGVESASGGMDYLLRDAEGNLVETLNSHELVELSKLLARVVPDLHYNRELVTSN